MVSLDFSLTTIAKSDITLNDKLSGNWFFTSLQLTHRKWNKSAFLNKLYVLEFFQNGLFYLNEKCENDFQTRVRMQKTEDIFDQTEKEG